MGSGWFIFLAFVFGLIVGSFLNVCIYRLPRAGMSIFKPSSHCPKCNTFIRWYENIPVLSYIFLRGCCRYCRATISPRYPLVELLTGGLFAGAVYFQFTSGEAFTTFQRSFLFVVYIYLVSTLVVATFIDFEFRIIPDEITISGIIIAPVLSVLFPFIHESFPYFKDGSHLGGLVASVVGIIAGGGVVYLVGWLGKIVFRKEAMGFGDVKLMAMLGGFLGWESILFVFFLGCLLGSVIGIILWIVTRDRYIAFGPYLALGALIMLFFKKQINIFVYDKYPELIKSLLRL